jgi:hypothetical protein
MKEQTKQEKLGRPLKLEKVLIDILIKMQILKDISIHSLKKSGNKSSNYIYVGRKEMQTYIRLLIKCKIRFELK